MAMTTLSVRMDENVKSGFEDFCTEVGMNASVAVNMFVRAVLRDQRLPFEVTTRPEDPFYSPENQARLRRAARRMESTGGIIHELIENADD